jgi:hypothetical protein
MCGPQITSTGSAGAATHDRECLGPPTRPSRRRSCLPVAALSCLPPRAGTRRGGPTVRCNDGRPPSRGGHACALAQDRDGRRRRDDGGDCYGELDAGLTSTRLQVVNSLGGETRQQHVRRCRRIASAGLGAAGDRFGGDCPKRDVSSPSPRMPTVRAAEAGWSSMLDCSASLRDSSGLPGTLRSLSPGRLCRFGTLRHERAVGLAAEHPR